MRIYLFYSSALVLSAVFTAALGFYAWNAYRYVEGRRIISIVFFLSTHVFLVYALLPWVDDPAIGFVIARLRFFGFSMSATMGLLFALQFAGKREWLHPSRVLLILTIPILSQIILWVEPLIPLFFSSWSLQAYNGIHIEISTYGGWYAIYWTFNTLCIGASVFLLIRSLPGNRGQQHRSILILTAMYILALILTQPGGTIPGYPELRLAPFGLVITSLGLLWLMMTKRLLDLTPVAYDVYFHSISDAVFILNNTDHIIQVNAAALDLALRSGSDGDPLRRKFADVLPQIEEALGQTDAIPLHLGSQKRQVSVQVSPLKRGDMTLGKLIMLRDVTDQYEASRKAMELELERERSRIVASFIRDASHEFRTPLTTIKTGLYLLRRVKDEENRKRQIEHVDRAADRILHLVQDLQTMVTLDSGGLTETQPIDVSEVAKLLIAELEKTATPASPSIHAEYGEGKMTVLGSSTEIEQALGEVLENALHHTPSEGSITLKLNCDAAQVVIAVRDTGAGMDADTVRQAFNRFYRLDMARTTAGFGLGLAITQKIVERHKGQITIESSPGKGTTITIRLPFHRFEDADSNAQQ